MSESQQIFLNLIKKISTALLFLFTTSPGILVLSASLLLIILIWISRTIHRASLLSKIAGKPFKAGAAFLAVMEALGGAALKLFFWLPAFLMITLIAVNIINLGTTISRVEESLAAAQKIKELTILVRNLEMNYKVADVHIISADRDTTNMRIDFYDPSRSGKAVETKELSIPGTDIYFDALVLNFDYSRIAEGRSINIAIPYRIFSDRIPQRDGLVLGANDIMGIPYMFNRSDSDIYGLSPEIYRQRLGEFMELVRSEEKARQEGIIRSVYGSAVHKKVKTGDRLEIRVEQSGGITLRDVRIF